VFDARGNPLHQRGLTTVPGLSFIGLPWLHTWGSGRFSGVSRDARHLVQHIASHRAEDGVRSPMFVPVV
jgi:putative flavoprotein involved in K+ transport